jgi:hypothetical protein
MAEAADFTDLSGAQLLDRVEVLAEAQRRAEVDILVAAAEFADQQGVGSVDPVAARRSGRERLVRLGGDGTPVVAEFAPVVFGARLGLSSWAARGLFADVEDLRFRLPNLWAALLAGRARVQHARFVARKTRELAPDAAGYVDLRLVGHCDGSLSWARRSAGGGGGQGRRHRGGVRPGAGRGPASIRQGDPVDRGGDARVLRARRLRQHRQDRRHGGPPGRGSQGVGR